MARRNRNRSREMRSGTYGSSSPWGPGVSRMEERPSPPYGGREPGGVQGYGVPRFGAGEYGQGYAQGGYGGTFTGSGWGSETGYGRGVYGGASSGPGGYGSTGYWGRGEAYRGGYPEEHGRSYGQSYGEQRFIGGPERQGEGFGYGRGRGEYESGRSQSYPEGYGREGYGMQGSAGEITGRRYGQAGSMGPMGSTGGYGQREEWGSQGISSSRSRRGPKGYQRSDERLREEIIERLMQRSDIDLRDLEVEVSGGNVTLSGNVGERSERHEIENIADSVWGIKDINNNLRVKSRQESEGQQEEGGGPFSAGSRSGETAPRSTSSTGRRGSF